MLGDEIVEKMAIFGGTFDPIHNGHLNIAYEALDLLNLDKIIFMPSGNPPHKLEKNVTDADIRYNLIEEGIKGEKRFEVSKFEILNHELSYTYITLEYFKHKYPDLYFLTGADCLMEIESWKNVTKILSLAKLIVFNRPPYKAEDVSKQREHIQNKYGGQIILLNAKMIDVSSTFIRSAIKNNINIEKFLPKKVYEIIKKEKLYR